MPLHSWVCGLPHNKRHNDKSKSKRKSKNKNNISDNNDAVRPHHKMSTAFPYVHSGIMRWEGEGGGEQGFQSIATQVQQLTCRLCF